MQRQITSGFYLRVLYVRVFFVPKNAISAICLAFLNCVKKGRLKNLINAIK